MHPVNVLKQVRSNLLPERVENNPGAFAPGQFGSRHEIAVSRRKDAVSVFA